MRNEKAFKMGELFCGPGGFGYAAKTTFIKTEDKSFRIVHAWANDYDQDTCNTYRLNVCPDKPDSVVCGDIRKLDMSVFKDISSIDALVFGFPCNDFSIVGEQKGINGTYGPLYKYGVKALQIFKPEWFVAENVGGLRSSNDGSTLIQILKELEEVGYKLTPHLYKFENYGIPQNRHRIIIVGIRDDLSLEYRVPSDLPYRELDTSVRKALTDPPIDESAANQEYTKNSPMVVERLKHIKPGENAFNADLPEHLKLNVRGARISQIYKRLNPDLPSYTITGSGGGGTHVYHWSENRALTNRERARIQTFPDSFVFKGSKESVRKQIGMAVPVRGAQIIFYSILQTFAGIPYPYIEETSNDFWRTS